MRYILSIAGGVTGANVAMLLFGLLTERYVLVSLSVVLTLVCVYLADQRR